jgi:hypothetical protein
VSGVFLQGDDRGSPPFATAIKAFSHLRIKLCFEIFEQPLGDFGSENPEVGWGFDRDLGIVLGEFGGKGEEFDGAGFEVAIGEGAAEGFEERGVGDHFGEGSQFCFVGDGSGVGREEDVDRAFGTQDGEVRDDLTEGGEEFLEEAFVELVEGFGGHG